VGRSWVFWIDAAFKIALVGLLAFGAFSGLDQFEGKAFGWRLVFYPLAAVVVPLGWWLAGRPKPYPYALDILLVSPFSSTSSATPSICTTRSPGGTTSTTS
jgi:hypothetical protein